LQRQHVLALGLHVYDLAAVDGFVEYILSLLDEPVREQLEALMEKRDLGRNKQTQGLGVLLPDYMVDFNMDFGMADEESESVE